MGMVVLSVLRRCVVWGTRAVEVRVRVDDEVDLIDGRNVDRNVEEQEEQKGRDMVCCVCSGSEIIYLCVLGYADDDS